MLKKSLVVLSIFFSIIFASSFVFAQNMTNSAENTMNSIGNGIHSAINATGNTLNHAKNGMSNMMNDMGNGIERTVDGIENGMSDDNNQTNTLNGTNDGDYTAMRTGATGNTENGINSTVVWTILAIAAVAIIALVWYYATRTNDVNNDRH